MESSEDYISTKSGEESDLSVEPVFPVRPKSSKMGKPISLRVNYNYQNKFGRNFVYWA